MLDATTMRRELAVFVRKDSTARSALERIAAHFGIAGGRKWSEFEDGEIERFYRYTLGGEVLPDAVAIESPPNRVEPEMSAAELDAHLDEIDF